MERCGWILRMAGVVWRLPGVLLQRVGAGVCRTGAGRPARWSSAVRPDDVDAAGQHTGHSRESVGGRTATGGRRGTGPARRAGRLPVPDTTYARAAGEEGWFGACLYRSALEAVFENFLGSAAFSLVDMAVVDEIDEQLRRRLPEAPASAAAVLSGIPEHHWWWETAVRE